MEPVHHARAVELPSVIVAEGTAQTQTNKQQQRIRIFSLSLRSTTVELCSLGASITRFVVGNDKDDIVLGYNNVETLFRSGNSKYFGVVVGRVANRIKEGKFTLKGNEYSNLSINNPPNHLHGGDTGFSRKIWDAEILPNNSNKNGTAIRFSMISEDGEEGYPGKIMVSATYSLRDGISNPKTSTTTSTTTKENVVLRVELQAKLLDGDCSPINLAQHSYFNLSRHDDKRGILDHQLYLDSSAYTPVDETSIPTREVRPVNHDPTMDFRRRRRGGSSSNDNNNNNNNATKQTTLEDAIKSFGTSKQHCGMSIENVESDLAQRQTLSNPYGFDHNYVVDNQPGLALPRVGSLSCGFRTLHVYSNAPGVQIYTSNYLDDREDKPPICKGNYGPWSGICLETQHFPDSIDETLVDDNDNNDNKAGLFGRGRCCILTAENPTYEHIVEYNLQEEVRKNEEEEGSNNIKESSRIIVGSDTSKNKYNSIEEMWAAQDLTTWYNRAKDYYEDNCSATVDGVLGGIGEISDIDLQGSRNFLDSLVNCFLPDKKPKSTTTKTIACEHGAGIGRVTKGILLDYCDQCDLIESSSRLLYSAPDYIGNSKSSKCRYYNVELQDWEGKPDYYTIIWIQWVACYLTDFDLLKYLRRCANSLVDDGIIVIKENTCIEEMFVVDCDDASLTRSHQYWLDIIYKTGVLEVEKIEWQEGFPTDIYPVPMIALKRRKH